MLEFKYSKTKDVFVVGFAVLYFQDIMDTLKDTIIEKVCIIPDDIISRHTDESSKVHPTIIAYMTPLEASTLLGMLWLKFEFRA